MKIVLAGKEFLTGQMGEVVSFLLKQLRTKKAQSKIVLPCSLNDLAAISQNQSQASSYQKVDYFVNDSMWLTFCFRWRSKSNLDRLYGPDLMKTILQNFSDKKHYFLAADDSIMLKLKEYLVKNYPHLSGEFDFLPKDISINDEKKFLQKVLLSQADVIWLGIGSPKQVQLAEFLKQSSQGKLIFCVGAAFEFLTGQKKQAPRLMQRIGLEWLFRLLSEPKRLWRRYLVTIPRFLLLSLKENLKL